MKKNSVFKHELFFTIVRITITPLLIIAFFSAMTFAHSLPAQELLGRGVSVKLQNVTLKEALTQLEKNTKVRFAYSRNVIKLNHPVSVTAQNEVLSSVLDKILSPLNIKYEEFNGQIFLSKKKTKAIESKFLTLPYLENYLGQANEVSIAGRVTDSQSGEGLPGVSVVIKGTSTGATTDANGNYKLNAPDLKVTLVLSYVGYLKQEVAVDGRSKVDVKLELDTKTLSEVVVVGYGNQERRDVTGAVAMVNAKNIKDLPLTSADQKLAGQVAGVQVNQVTGAPGGGVVIRVRGSGSIGAGDDPLYVIDGFPVTNGYSKYSNPLSTLNPDDIESITVLKDAASTSIYGSRGANGVILISTKKAKSGISNIDFNFYTGVQTVPENTKIKMMTAEELANFRIESRQDAAAFAGKPFDPATIPADYANPASLGRGTDWFDELTHVAPLQSYNLTITKGTENLRSLISAGYFSQEGVVRNSNFERYSMRVNVEGNPRKNILVGVNLNPSFVNRKIGDSEGHFNTAILTQGALSSPLTPVRQADGSLTKIVTSTDLFANANPLSVLTETKNTQSSVRLLGNAFVTLTLAKGLTFKSTFNIDWNSGKGDYFKPSYVGTFRSPPPLNSNGSTSSSKFLNWLNENTINYDKSIGKHRISALAGYTIQTERSEGFTVNGSLYPDDVVQTINAATVVTTSAYVEVWKLLSTLARVNYAYADKYLVSATVRRDGSSRFGPNNRYAVFPSVSAGWRISEEDFFSKNGVISDLKVRASYGLAGNNSIGNYTYIPTITADNYVFGGALSSGFKLNSLANADLGWESSRQLDLGFDAELLNGRIFFSTELYRRFTENMLQSVDIPIVSGFSSAITNIGNVRNQGLEFTINSKNTTGALKWDTDFNLAFNRNKVIDLGNKTRILSGAETTNITTVGMPMGQFYGYVFQGIFQSQAELDASPKQAGQVVGSVKYADVNGDGKIDANDKTSMGSPYAKFIWGLTNRFSYRNFDLSVLINGSHGAKVLDLYKRFTTNIDGVFNVEAEVKDRWRSTANPGNGRIPTTVANTALSREINSLWVNDASFVAVRNITLGYRFKTPWTNNVRVYATAQNALLFSPYKNGWPEVNVNGNNSLAPGVNYTGYPVSASYNIGANIQF
jgi:TonB-linked SusC/RagA family outer membrane protein